MARLPRLVLPGLPHLLIQRGHNRQPVFVDDTDREAYLAALREAAANQRVAVHAYVLLPDEVMLLATPPDAEALGRMMQALGRRYVAAFNARHGRSGTLWEGRYRAAVLEPTRYFLPCCCYIEQSPVRAGLCERAEDWRWSSHAHHRGARNDPLVSGHALYWALGNTPFEREAAYRRLFETLPSAADLRALSESALRGWPLGSPAFLQQLQRAGHAAAPKPPGRPRKTPESVAVKGGVAMPAVGAKITLSPKKSHNPGAA
ncbi:transposase [Caldimonas tepidiphila]|uniref:transposase n=1 Tax=Caldimonas tepidiphila TaxID=2315841 RepID=UPI001F0CA2CC|nr:transposase [Caldimonas tepidiphila]